MRLPPFIGHTASESIRQLDARSPNLVCCGTKRRGPTPQRSDP